MLAGARRLAGTVGVSTAAVVVGAEMSLGVGTPEEAAGAERPLGAGTLAEAAGAGAPREPEAALATSGSVFALVAWEVPAARVTSAAVTAGAGSWVLCIDVNR